jgi:long-chain fatty acid transport protein
MGRGLRRSSRMPGRLSHGASNCAQGEVTVTSENQMRQGASIAAATLSLLMASTAAQATEGYFALGYGPGQRALAGAGVARGSEPMSAAVNPAGVASVGKQLQLGFQLFAPFRGYTGTGTGFVPSGSVTSKENLFPIPNISYNLPLENGAVFNFSAYGNGGMNTTYPTGLGGCGSVYCGGRAGVDLTQLFLSATYARKVGAISYGIAPTIAIQRFGATGLGAFSAISVDPAHLTDTGYDMSYGYGLRAGIEVEVSPTFQLGLAGQTKMRMTKFKKYAGLFENGGDFDIPASITAGLAWKARPDLTVLADYQRIFYSGVGAVGNANTAGPLGAPGGAGFGWDDVDVVKLAVEWQESDRMTWRAGYAYVSNPIGPEDVTLNIIAPGIVKHHLAGGGSYRIDDRNTLDFSVDLALHNSISGPETTPGGPTGGTVKLNMHQVSASIGWTRRF